MASRPRTNRRLNLEIPPRLDARLRQELARTELPLSIYIRQALREKLDRDERLDPARIIAVRGQQSASAA